MGTTYFTVIKLFSVIKLLFYNKCTTHPTFPTCLYPMCLRFQKTQRKIKTSMAQGDKKHRPHLNQLRHMSFFV